MKPSTGSFDRVTATTRTQRQLQTLRRTVVESLRVLITTTRGLTPAQYELPAPFSEWQVRLLVGRTLWFLTDVAGHLDTPSVSRPLTLDTYAAELAVTREQRHQRSVAVVGTDSGPSLGGQFVALAEDIIAMMGDDDLPPLVDTGVGQLSLLDFLRWLVTQLVLTSDDIGRSLAAHGHEAPTQGREAIATAVRTMADILAARAPGQAIEVRVPPYAAVQIGDPAGAVSGRLAPAPTHTRGTPPAVIEMDAATFLRITTGRLSWDEAAAGHLVAASGLRADLSPLLPLTR